MTKTTGVDGSASKKVGAGDDTSAGSSFIPRELKFRLYDPVVDSDSYVPEKSYNWADHLDIDGFATPPVHAFPNAPLADVFRSMTVGVKIEVPNMDYVDTGGSVFWMASIIRLAGYKALVRYEGMDEVASHDFWVNLCTSSVHPIGYCANKNFPLCPPKCAQQCNPQLRTVADWKKFLSKKVTGSRTPPLDFTERVVDEIKTRIRPGMRVEMVDKSNVRSVKPARVCQVVGDRLRLVYAEDDSDKGGEDFWCHRKSPLLHPVGWAVRVGHNITCSARYKADCESKLKTGDYDNDDATPDLFDKPPKSGNHLLRFDVGMKLEALDPLELSNIAPATVESILHDGYVMVAFDGTNDAFCYHESSPYIFPTEFCEKQGITLKAGRANFRWSDYLKQTKSTPAPSGLFQMEQISHEFRVGQKVECTDLIDPRLICVATIGQVYGRLLRIHFDGWNTDFDQFVDACSPDVFPIGYCEMVGHHLERDKQADDSEEDEDSDTAPVVAPEPKKKKGQNKGASHKGGRRASASTTLVPVVSPVTATTDGGSSVVYPEAIKKIAIVSWSVEQVEELLKANELENAALQLSKHGVDGEQLLGLTQEKLCKNMQLKISSAVRVMELVGKLRQE